MSVRATAIFLFKEPIKKEIKLETEIQTPAERLKSLESEIEQF
jgi:hypothetical protein